MIFRRRGLLKALVTLPAVAVSPALVSSSDASASEQNTSEQSKSADELIQSTDTPGAILGWGSGAKTLAESHGFASFRKPPLANIPMMPDAVMPIGSVGKLIVGAMVIEVLSSGELKLDDPLHRFVPGFPAAERMTLEMLGKHTSGLAEPIAQKLVQTRVMSMPDQQWSHAELIDIMSDQPLLAKPGEKFSYSNLNTVLLAKVIEQVTKLNFAAYAHHWLQKNRLFNTSLPASLDWRQQGIRGYRYAAKGRAIGYGKIWMDVSHLNPSWSGAGGNWSSSVSDLIALGSRVLPRIWSGLSPAQRSQLLPGKGHSDYGFHIQWVNGQLGHPGDVPGFSSALVLFFETRQAAAVMTNLSNFKNGSSPALALLAAWSRARLA